MSYNNHTDAPSVSALIASWIEEDLDALRNERVQIDARIQRLEQRLLALRDTQALLPESVPADGGHRAVRNRVESRASVAPSAPKDVSLGTVVMDRAADQPVSSQTNESEIDDVSDDGDSGHEAALALHYKFGVVRASALASSLGVDDDDARALLENGGRWSSSDHQWYVRTSFEQSWMAKRILEILIAVRSISIEPLYQAVKRVATSKFLEQGCVMPTRTMLINLVQELRTEGVQFDIVREVASVDPGLQARQLSGTARAIVDAFNSHHRALTGSELTAMLQQAGMSEGSATVALSTSPILNRIERGIYALVGRNPELRDISNARMRREAGRAPVEAMVVND